MRIGYFIPAEPWGGAEIYTFNMMRGSKDAGHKVVLFGAEGSRLFELAGKEGIECVSWTSAINLEVKGASGKSRFRLTGLLPAWFKLLAGSVKEILHLRGIFSRNRPGVMYVNVSGYEVAGIACRLCRIPALGMYHNAYIRRDSFLRRFLDRKTIIFYDHLIGPSRYSIDSWNAQVRLPPERWSLIPHGIDISVFSGSVSEKQRQVGDGFRLVSVSRLDPMKGIDYLIRALKMMNDPRISLDILGEGSEEARLKELVRELGLEERVRFRGFISDPRAYLDKAHCFVLASVFLESFGMALVEAMASGLPVVTSDFGPLEEVNIHGATGLVVPAGNSGALAQAFRQLMDDPAFCVKMGKAGRERAVVYFSKDRMVNETLALCGRVLKINKPQY